ncbi:MAG: hypothetical protein J6W00_03685 [Lentisphaeria bacterium]|nr:hypothetical protein [Lentisphaeria bacterium]
MKKVWALVLIALALIGVIAWIVINAWQLPECQECKKNLQDLTVFRIKQGETWVSISKKYKITRNYLISINRCISDELTADEILVIPAHHLPEAQRLNNIDKRALGEVRGVRHFLKGEQLFSEKKYSEAVKFFDDAADFGDFNAIYRIGQCYENGVGVEKDVSKAIAFYRLIGDVGEVSWFENYFPHKAREALNKIKIASVPELEDVKFVYTPQTNGKKAKMEFSRDGKVLLSLTSKVDRLCFMEEISSAKESNHMRISFSHNHEEKDFDLRTMLLDLHGDDDFRYLLIADYHTGTSPTGHRVYIVDAKNDFKFIAEIDGGEIMDITYGRKHFVFSKEILNLGYFGVEGDAVVRVPLCFGVGETPRIMYKKVELTAGYIDDIVKYYQKRQQESVIKDENVIITLLYASLIEDGHFNSAKMIAAKLGYSPEYIEKFHAGIIREIKNSPNSKIIAKFNNLDLSKM